MSSNHALVFGASGISGIPLLRNLLPNTSFARVTGLTSRPLTLSPKEQEVFNIDVSSPKLQLAAGLDLSKPTEQVKQFLRDNVKDISTVTHVFFAAYREAPDITELVRVNIAFLRHAIEALNELCADSLELVLLQTGGKYYGVEYQDEITLHAPLKEDVPRQDEPRASRIFYYGQVDILKELSQGRRWTWVEVRPDAVIGTVPRGNFMNIAAGLAIYLSVKAALQPGTTVTFPGTEISYKTTHSDTDHDIMARFEIDLALKATSNSQKAYNIANGDVVSWATVWPGICAYFGLEGAPPSPSGQTEDIVKFVKDNKAAYLAKTSNKAPNAQDTLDNSDSALVFSSLNREYDLTSAQKLVGFTETIDTVKSYTTQFDKMKALGLIA
ncbi:hypothetical protein OE88DRAFT_1683886 [Heliocybe sulcata]|uniref:PRISE-like Rossmann-fold domain-containing protein n=1 Tax=Heliocybe sulcata TaxID=5364 RepID=A0A5C3N4D3_9AGAM|nr:hypothetical protein OE88DRAFT_1683886 [Heliocybe sulcata]